MRIALLAVAMAVLLGTGPAWSEDAKPAGDQAKPAADKGGGEKSAAKKGAAKGKSSGPSDEQIADQLKAFCVKWMGFLETRERDNKKAIKWEKNATGVAG